MVSALCFSLLSNATKNVAQSVNYKIEQKKSEFERNTKKIYGFERFLSKIRDIEKNCLLIDWNPSGAITYTN